MGRGGRGHGGRSHGGGRSHFGGHRSHGHHHHHHGIGMGMRVGVGIGMGVGMAAHHHHRRTHHTTHYSSTPRYIPPPLPIPNAIFALEMDGLEDICGCPGESSIIVKSSNILPPSLTDLYTPTEWTTFTGSIKKMIDDASCPVCPWFFLCFFVWPCCKIAKVNQQQTKMEQLIVQENIRLADVGLKWEPTQPHWRQFNEILTLVWLPNRKDFEQMNPHRRPVSTEFPPHKYCSPEQLAAQGLPPNPYHAMLQMPGAVPMMPMGGAVQPIYVQPAPGQQYLGPPQQQTMGMQQPIQPQPQPVMQGQGLVMGYHPPPMQVAPQHQQPQPQPQQSQPPYHQAPYQPPPPHPQGTAYYQPSYAAATSHPAPPPPYGGPVTAPSHSSPEGATAPPPAATSADAAYGITRPDIYGQPTVAAMPPPPPQHGACAKCGSQRRTPDDRFCSGCGAPH